ncbi:MAG: DUF3592 domain-containing protein [candidate division WWE3 bacterium]|nr:DUF3592 domain-containing protein [candidate division WWE3 bacterium]
MTAKNNGEKLIKIITKPLGVVAITISVLLFAVVGYKYLLTKPSFGVITKILQRTTGVEYRSVSQGSVYPCKLTFEYFDESGQKISKTTNYETDPCSPDNVNYYKVGQEISVRFDPVQTQKAEIFGVWDKLLSPTCLLIFGIVSLLVSRDKSVFIKPKNSLNKV